MPVSAWISGGMGTPGSTSDDHSSTGTPPSTSTMPTSVIRSSDGETPEVSRSTKA